VRYSVPPACEKRQDSDIARDVGVNDVYPEVFQTSKILEGRKDEPLIPHRLEKEGNGKETKDAFFVFGGTIIVRAEYVYGVSLALKLASY